MKSNNKEELCLCDDGYYRLSYDFFCLICPDYWLKILIINNYISKLCEYS